MESPSSLLISSMISLSFFPSFSSFLYLLILSKEYFPMVDVSWNMLLVSILTEVPYV